MKRQILSKLVRSICIILFLGTSFLIVFPFIAYTLKLASFLSENLMGVLGVIIVVSILVTAGWTFKNRVSWRTPKIVPLFLLLAGLLLIQPFAFMQEAFGEWRVGSLLLTFQENQGSKLLSIGISDFGPELLNQVFYLLLALGAALVLLSSWPSAHKYVSAVGIVAFLSSPLVEYGLLSVIPNPAHALAMNQLEDGHEIIARPIKKKNLIIVYLESLERTYGELEETRTAFAPFAALEREALSFDNIDQVLGASFTAGGMVASQCGVPLLPKGVFGVGRKMGKKVDAIPNFTKFLPNIVCLGDILKNDGYAGSYINGSSLSVFSKGDFFLTHGYQRVFGLESYPGWETEPRTNIWGMNDDLLFKRVKDELRHLATSEKPFVLSTLTLSTHGPNAYLSTDCVPSRGAVTLLPKAISCTGHYVNDLLAEIDRLGIREDTVVLLISDHLAVRNTLYPSLLERADDRRNLVMFLTGDVPQTINRYGSMMDIYPTILDILGYELADGRANLGVSLLHDTKNFLEVYGKDTFDRGVNGNSEMQKLLWQTKNSE
ncbi:sulfatase-like hydrolase/transferase [Aliiroseovarius sp. KMU-50]|uniref:Sulfatase-like hydrolase/transferase n=1 Tax=Aliiroseovarius salicola TaxID=3009082 RepID=A0ABT4W003_9RHOB|nr:sulfatase-like hydrolase/transferase [Aliiroseovarius sp. KMU-50]MDA5093108.1 sulfatase-like hydrolase/transferase [Aliiroseovarius sp. KMU-50]